MSNAKRRHRRRWRARKARAWRAVLMERFPELAEAVGPPQRFKVARGVLNVWW